MNGKSTILACIQIVLNSILGITAIVTKSNQTGLYIIGCIMVIQVVILIVVIRNFYGDRNN